MTQPTGAVTPRPYRMHNQIQHYAWGTRGEEAFIPHLLGFDPDEEKPYAELWLGAHPKAPSNVELENGTLVPLDAWIAEHPVETLGDSVAAQFEGLPFLLKILSAGQSLSIQAHPTKVQAELLHAQDPEHYPDDNHKPEIAVALDGLTALVGVKPLRDLAMTLKKYPEIAGFAGPSVVQPILDAGEGSTEDILSVGEQRELSYALFAACIQRSLEASKALQDAVDALAQRLTTAGEDLNEAEERFLTLRGRYGNDDVGLFALFLFNIVHLEAGEGIFTQAGVPHAYLEGNIVECMANSDNVVRVGLTPKHKDAKALLKIVDATPQAPEILTGQTLMQDGGTTVRIYKTPTDEFEIRRWHLASAATPTRQESGQAAILLVTSGEITLTWEEGRENYRQGEAAFLPACLSTLTLQTSGGAEIIEAIVPEQG
jgi:mannose-6-phosphate isomerase